MTPRTRPATSPTCLTADNHETRRTTMESRNRVQITYAMNLLHAGVDITVIALWLGHESPATTRIYLHADMKLKEDAIARTAPPGTEATRYKAPDTLLAFLDQL